MAAPRVEIVPATPELAREMAPRMRPAEVAEVAAAEGFTPEQALLESLARSEEAWAALFDGQVACMWGVVVLRRTAVGGHHGGAWLLTTDLVERHPKAFWRGCRAEVGRLLSRYASLTNAIDTRHAKAVRWALRLGFPLEAPAPFGVEGQLFHHFTARREDAWAPSAR